jgi:hypothetical protein
VLTVRSGMLCAVCTSILEGRERSGHHHSSLESLKRAAEESCQICVYAFKSRTKSSTDAIPDAWKSSAPYMGFEMVAIGPHGDSARS